MPRQLFWALAAAGVLTSAASAGPPIGGGPPVQFQVGLNPQFKVSTPDSPSAPWYLYWPAEARYLYKAPGPMPYPFWPNQNGAPPLPGPMAVPPSGAEPVPDMDLGPSLVPTAYWWYRP